MFKRLFKGMMPQSEYDDRIHYKKALSWTKKIRCETCLKPFRPKEPFDSYCSEKCSRIAYDMYHDALDERDELANLYHSCTNFSMKQRLEKRLYKAYRNYVVVSDGVRNSMLRNPAWLENNAIDFLSVTE